MLLPAVDLRDPKKDISFPSSQDEPFVNRNVTYFKRCAVRTDLSYTKMDGGGFCKRNYLFLIPALTCSEINILAL